MERTETIKSPSWTGIRILAPGRVALVFGSGISASNVFQNHFPLNAGGMGGAVNMKITKRTQSKNGKAL
jgi:hypothetical protein